MSELGVPWPCMTACCTFQGLANVTMSLFRASDLSSGAQLHFQKSTKTDSDGVWAFSYQDVTDGGPAMSYFGQWGHQYVDSVGNESYVGDYDGSFCEAPFSCSDEFIVVMTGSGFTWTLENTTLSDGLYDSKWGRFHVPPCSLLFALSRALSLLF